MSIIYAVYGATEPSFPASEQNAVASRYLVAGNYVDADSEPSTAEVSAFIASIGDVTAGALLKVEAGGGLAQAVPGQDYVAPGGAGGGGLNGGEF